MQPLFLYPLAFIAFASLPALVAIYLLRNRFRRRTVSSLMLWIDAREARAGGTRLRRLQTPLLFLLELLILLLLVFSASEPQLRLTQGTRPLVVVLDDSFSMLAGGERSSRNQALEALDKELRKQMPYSVRFVVAGERPQVLGEPVHSARRAMEIVQTWQCRAPAARLDQAMSLGAEMGGELALLLVLTDHPPEKGAVPEKGRVQWWSFGRSRGNLALVNAARTSTDLARSEAGAGREGADRCLLEVANLSDEKRQTTLVIEPLETGPAIRRTSLHLEAGETQRLVLQFPRNAPAVRARIDEDDLAIDNEVILQPAAVRPVRVDVRLLDRRLREPLARALKSARNADLAGNLPPELIFTDRADEPDAPEGAWLVQLISEKEATAYAGPFVLDRAHPLTEGLSLRGAVWGAGKGTALDGAPVVMAGNVPLLADTETPITGGGARHDLRIRWRPDLSTLQDTPDWPILIWNLVNWRASALPGLSRYNVRLGEQVMLNLPSYRETVEVTAPGGRSRTVSVKGRQLALRADEVGVYEVRSEGTTYRFAVNALQQDESDLRRCEEGRWGDWLDETSLRLEYRPISWVLLLLLLGVACVHLLLMARTGRMKAEG
jgi:hypothetical protein